MIEPVQELTSIAKSYGSLVLVDGAHAPGVVEIDVESIGCDYYTGNCHKWLFASKGCAFLWTSRAIYNPLSLSSGSFPRFLLFLINSFPFIYFSSLLFLFLCFLCCLCFLWFVGEEGKSSKDCHPQPTVISSTSRLDYAGRFAYTGTRDYVAYCVLPTAVRFIEEKLGGFSAMREYCQLLLKEGSEYLIKQWKTAFLIPLSMNGFMSNVILPCSDESKLLDMQKQLMEKYTISIVFEKVLAKENYSSAFCSTKLAEKGELENKENTKEGKRWIYFIRISTQVYIEFHDFIQLGKAVKEILK
jgi:selenocysteine lyase/cysteine desulfurase